MRSVGLKFAGVILAAAILPGLVSFWAFADPPGGGGGGQRLDCEFEIVMASTGCALQPPAHWCDTTNCAQFPCPGIGDLIDYHDISENCKLVRLKSLGCNCVDGQHP